MSEFIVNRHCGRSDCKYISITVDPEFIDANVGTVFAESGEVYSAIRLDNDRLNLLEAATEFVRGVRSVHE